MFIYKIFILPADLYTLSIAHASGPSCRNCHSQTDSSRYGPRRALHGGSFRGKVSGRSKASIPSARACSVPVLLHANEAPLVTLHASISFAVLACIWCMLFIQTRRCQFWLHLGMLLAVVKAFAANLLAVSEVTVDGLRYNSVFLDQHYAADFVGIDVTQHIRNCRLHLVLSASAVAKWLRFTTRSF